VIPAGSGKRGSDTFDRVARGAADSVTNAILVSVTPCASVVVPVFNGLPYLRDLVEALQQQDYPNLEIVLCDGGSTDGSLEYLTNLTDDRIRVIAMPTGTTAAMNWTAATQAASGEFIKLICQDDLIDAHTMTWQVDDLERHPDSVMAIAPRRIIDAHGATLARRRGCQGLTPGVHPGAQVIRRCYVTGTNVIGEPLAVTFRREPLLQCMPWDDRNPLMLDVSLYTKVAPRGVVVVRADVIGSFRVSSSSWSTRLAGVQREQYSRWRREYEADLPGGISPIERLRARLGMERQVLTRRLAYRFLNARGGLVKPE